ncbi:putative Anion-selective porin [Nitrospira japonica]|uniref:Putative Anion-selective porin n=1 Tax=Nitrospira japonica TaxID=1325564 RepID=A0A1W1I7M3_9BACT|nr:porin [Nitrospira japonica]SLM49000.1 putative Anion-selective porin [Nitrospira japonica]
MMLRRWFSQMGFGPRAAKAIVAMNAAVLLSLVPDLGQAVDSGKLVEKNGEYVFVESMDPATRLLLERSYEKGIITQEERDKAIKESESRAYLMQPSFKLWYDRGFNFSMNDNAFLLKIRGRLQMRETTRWRNDAWRNPGDAKNYPELLGVFGDYRANRSDDFYTQFNIRRARLLFLGHLINPDFKYFVQLGFETAENAQTPGAANLLDFYFLSTHFSLFNVQAGQYKVFFNRSQINNTASMQFAERSLVQDAFTASGLNRRDVGITIMNDDEVYPVNYYLGVYNGAGPLFNRYGTYDSEEATVGCPGGQTGGNPFPSPAGCPTNSRNLNANFRNEMDKLMYAGRLQWNIMGRPGYGEGDLAYSEKPQMAVGGGLAYNPGINTSTDNAFVGIDLANLNFRRQLATFGNGRQLGWGVVNYLTHAFDGVFKYRGFSLQGEYYFKNVERTFKGAPCLQTAGSGGPCTAQAPGLLGNSTGFYVQSGYYLIPRKVEVAARYSYWDPDTNASGDLIKQLDASINWFPFGTYDYQVMLTYTNLAMGTGGYAIGRSSPLPSTGGSQSTVPCPATFPSGCVPLDARGGTLIENAIRLQFQIFF